MKGVDDWDRKKWDSELAKCQVLVMIHQVLLDALSRGYIKIRNLALIIIDECHHAVKNPQALAQAKGQPKGQTAGQGLKGP